MDGSEELVQSLDSERCRRHGVSIKKASLYVGGCVGINAFICLLFKLTNLSAHSPGHGFIILWAAAVNLVSIGVIIAFAGFASWHNHLTRIAALDLLTSLIPIALIACVHWTGENTKNLSFGLIYVGYIFVKGVVFVSNALINAEHGHSAAPNRWVLTVSMLIYAAATPWVALNAWPDGDEPHYLLLTHSLIADHDFDLSNNYRHGDYRTFYPPQLADHHTLINSRGQEFPIHDVGLPLLLTPGYAVGGRLGTMLELNVIAAILALGMYILARDVGANVRNAIATWGLFAFSSPLVVFSSQVSPEVVGGVASVWAVIAFGNFMKTGRLFPLAVVGLLLSVLPWFNVRFWMIVAPMLAAIGICILGQVRSRSKLETVKSLSLLMLPLVFSVGLFAVFDLRYYNTALPNAGYFIRVGAMNEPHFTADIKIGLLGLFFDKSFGLLTTAPVYVVALAGACVLLKRDWWMGGLVIFVSSVYILFSASSRWWYGGWCPPARLICASAALLAPFASLVISRTKFTLIFVLGAWSLLVGAGFTAFPLARYSVGDTAALAGVLQKLTGRDYGVIFPSLLRAAPSDYLLVAFWAATTGICVWYLLRRQRNIQIA